jgi:hypothetical protein
MAMTDNIADAKTAERTSASDGFIDADAENITLFPQQVTDNLMHVIIGMGAELWTMKRRMMVLERVLEKVGVSSSDVEQFTPSAEDQAAWKQERDIFIARTFGALTRKGGANAMQLDASRSM